MMSKEDSEAKSEMKITRLQLILKLLEEEEDEQSMGKEKPASGGMPIHKMSENKPPDGTADDSEQISTKPGGSMQICKIDGIEHTDAKISSEQTDVKGSTAHGTESIPKKPPLHHKLTGLFSLKEQSVEAEENSGDEVIFIKFRRLSLKILKNLCRK